jgi:hypothetical protein
MTTSMQHQWIDHSTEFENLNIRMKIYEIISSYGMLYGIKKQTYN